MSEFIIEDVVLKRYNGNSKNIVIPQGVEIIDKRALADKELESVILPESLVIIQNGAFANKN